MRKQGRDDSINSSVYNPLIISFHNVTKQNHFDKASNTFAGSGVTVTLNGRPYLGATIGSHEYIEEYVCEFHSARMVIQHQYRE